MLIVHVPKDITLLICQTFKKGWLVCLLCMLCIYSKACSSGIAANTGCLWSATPLSRVNQGAGGNHISGPVVPTVPFWNIIAMMANMAKRPLAISAFSFLFLTSGSSIDGAFGIPNGPHLYVFRLVETSVKPKTSREESLPGGSFGLWFIANNSMARPKKTICVHPTAGTLVMAARPCGTSLNFRPVDGERYPGHLKYPM